MTDDELVAIWERWAAATPGPWRTHEDLLNDGALEVVTDGDWGRQTLLCYRHVLPPGDFAQYRNPADAVAIAHAPEDIGRLLREVARLRRRPQ